MTVLLTVLMKKKLIQILTVEISEHKLHLKDSIKMILNIFYSVNHSNIFYSVNHLNIFYSVNHLNIFYSVNHLNIFYSANQRWTNFVFCLLLEMSTMRGLVTFITDLRNCKKWYKK
jgi:hypothetical protein